MLRTRIPPGCSSGLRPALYGAVLLVALVTGCSKSGSAPANRRCPPPLPVTVAAMQPTQVPIIVEVMAQTEGAKETEVRARSAAS